MTYIQSNKGGRPRKAAPLDQKITITVTLEEYELIKGEATKSRSPSLASFIRNRIKADPDIKSWSNSAKVALKTLELEGLRKLDIKKEISRVQKEKDLAIRNNEVDRIKNFTSHLIMLREQITGDLPEPRKARLITRVSSADRERIVYQANKLNLSVSDYARLKIFGYEPGEEGNHLSSLSKRKFYLAIQYINSKGWGTMPIIAPALCENCGKTLEN